MGRAIGAIAWGAIALVLLPVDQARAEGYAFPRSVPALSLRPAAPSPPPVPTWLTWLQPYLLGHVTLLRPSWMGTLGAPGTGWSLGLECSLKGSPFGGFGPALDVSWGLSWPRFSLATHLSAIVPVKGGWCGTAELSFGLPPFSLEARVGPSWRNLSVRGNLRLPF
jgi:hypothetical protein